MRPLSKSKLMAYRQCPKRLWLELHRPELRDDSGTEAAFAAGQSVAEVARDVFDTAKKGVNLDPNEIGWDEARERTAEELADGGRPIFEALLSVPGALALADIMRPDPDYSELRWEMIEVKGSSSVKDYQRDDLAIQTYITERAGVPLSKAGLAHVDTGFVYPGGGDYEGLFQVEDLTGEARGRRSEVAQWLHDAQVVAALGEAPEIEVGPHCTDPFVCGFCAHCHAGIVQSEDPFVMLPNLRSNRKEAFELSGINRLEDIPDEQLSEKQLLVKSAHLNDEPFFDAETARRSLEQYNGTAYFLDFETVMLAVPIWAGTRPYQNVPFQYSLHRIESSGDQAHFEFLNLDGVDPRRALAEQMIADCGHKGPVFVYNESFERRIIQELAGWFPDLEPPLGALLERIVDLHPIAKECYYHPVQNGSWSLKAVAPAIAPELSYSDLQGVQVGSDAGIAYLEAIAPETSPERREELRRQLLEYCKLDTLATVRIWEYFKGASFLSE